MSERDSDRLARVAWAGVVAAWDDSVAKRYGAWDNCTPVAQDTYRAAAAAVAAEVRREPRTRWEALTDAVADYLDSVDAEGDAEGWNAVDSLRLALSLHGARMEEQS